MVVSRQRLLKLGLLGGASLVLPAGRLTQAILADAIPSSPVFPPFLRPLPIAPTLVPSARDATADYYAVTMQPALAQILPDPKLKTPVWTYNGLYPGPTFQVMRGRTVQVRQTNMLPEATSMHLHGAVVDGNSDGHALDLIPPGGVKVYTYPNTEHLNPDRQSARTQWYHDHAIDATGAHVYKGLAGFYLIHDDLEAELQLPSGAYDIPLVIQDRRFNADGSLFFPPFPDFDSENGVFGDTIVVNGAMQPFLQVEPRRYRFRVLNGSNARQYELALSSGQPLMQIATEGGLLPTPVPRSSLFIAQAERYEFIIDFTGQQGNHIVLRNLNGQSNAALNGQNSTDEILRFDVVLPLRGQDTSAALTATTPMRPIARISESAATVTRHFRFERTGGMWAVNGLFFDKTLVRVDANPRAGDVEIWELENASGGWTHPIHIHLINFQILDRNGAPPAPGEAGWKEVVLLHHNETVRVIMQWYDVPDGPARTDGLDFKNKYVFHCHNLEHEDHMMMGEIEVRRRL